MKKNFKTIFSLIILFLISVIIVGCANKAKSGNLPAYEFSSHTVFADEMDTDMVIDGKLDEENWDSCEKYINYLNGVKVEVTSYMTVKGVYLAMTAYDKDIYHSQPYVFEKNTNFLLRICADGVDNLHPAYNKQFQIDAKHIKSSQMARVSSAIFIDGEGINSSNNKSFTAEMFISWQALNIDTTNTENNMPEMVRIYLIYSHKKGKPVKEQFDIVPGFGALDKPSMYFAFGAKGYLNADKENSVLGDAASGYGKSNGWDLSEIGNGKVKTISDNWQYIFFKNKASKSYIFEATVKAIGGINDNFPNVGVLAGFKDIKKYRTLFFSASTQNLNDNRLVFTNLTNYPNGWSQTPTTYEKVLENNQPNIKDGVKIKVIKSGGLFQYYINDNYAYSEYLDYLEDECFAGLYSLGCETEFTDYRLEDYTDREQEIKLIVNQKNYVISSNRQVGGEVVLESQFVGIGESATLTINPANEFMLTDIKQNGESIYSFTTQNINNGKVIIDNITEDTVFDAKFEKIRDNLSIISGKITDQDTLEKLSMVTVKAIYGNGLMVVSTFSNSNGDFTISLPKLGSHFVDGKEITIDENYLLSFNLNNDINQYEEKTIEISPTNDIYTENVELIKDKKISYPKLSTTYKLPNQNAKTISFPMWKFDSKNKVLTHSMAMPEGQYDRNYFTDFAYEDFVISTVIDTTSKTGAHGGIVITTNENDIDFHAAIMVGNNGNGTYNIVLSQFKPWVESSGVFTLKSNVLYKQTNSNQAKLTVVKKDGVLYIFADDNYIAKIDNTNAHYTRFEHQLLNQNILQGIVGAGFVIAPIGKNFTGTLTGVEFTNYYYSAHEEIIDGFISSIDDQPSSEYIPSLSQTYTLENGISGTTGNALWKVNAQGITAADDFPDGQYNRNFFADFHADKYLAETVVMTNNSSNRYGGILVVNKIDEVQHQVGIFIKHSNNQTYKLYLAQFFPWIDGVSGLNEISGEIDYSLQGEVKLSLVQKDGVLYIFTDGELRYTISHSNEFYNRFEIPGKNVNMLNLSNAIGLVVTRHNDNNTEVLAFKNHIITTKDEIINGLIINN